MAESSYGFRTAVGGFHKGDVIGFIEKTAAQHRSELLEYQKTITSQQEEILSLQQQPNLLLMATPVAPKPEPKAEPAPATVDKQELMKKELLAYRRAKEFEQNANFRAKELYIQLGDLCDAALEDFQTTDSAVKQTIEAMLEQANSLEQSYRTLSEALQASREKLAAMNEMFGMARNRSKSE